MQEAGWAPGPAWTRAENLAPTGIRSPDRPVRSQSLYRLRYPAHYVMSTVSKNSGGIRWGLCGQITDLDYADDICLLAYSTGAMQIMLGRIEKEAAKLGLKINVNKTKELRTVMDSNETLIVV